MRFVSIDSVGRALPLALGLTLAAAPALVAQEEADVPEETQREHCICFDPTTAGNVFAAAFARPNRARIGVVLGGPEEVEGRTGIVIQAVTDAGPADRAGLRAGDIITALDGAALGSEPGRGLVEAMEHVEPGDTVALIYYRDGERRTADLVAEAPSTLGFLPGGERFEWVAPRLDRGRPQGRTGYLDVVTPRALMRGLRSGLELAELNPALGEYFGTDEGVLVTDIEEDSGLGLRPGDVIHAIDGREVRDAAHVRAILDSYRADEPITLEIVRRERRMEVVGTADG